MPTRIEVRASVISCTSCELHTQCNHPVPFDGPSPNDIAVIGEAPGHQEDRFGKPFVGSSGALLRKELGELNVEGTYLNAVSCYPNRRPATPRSNEVQACRDNVWTQLLHIKPRFLLLVGNTAVSSWWPNLSITEIRGQFWRCYWSDNNPNMAEQGDGWGWAFATWHPAAILRDRGLSYEWKEDLKLFSEVAQGKASIPPFDKCVKCGEEGRVFWWDIAYCEAHAPKLDGTTRSFIRRVKAKPREEPREQIQLFI